MPDRKKTPKEKLSGALHLARIYCYARLQLCRCRRKKQISANPDIAVIVPCDPWSGIGSRGDEAMIRASVSHLSAKPGIRRIVLPVSEPRAKVAIEAMGLDGVEAEVCWGGKNPLKSIMSWIERQNPCETVILGADCMDGKYSSSISVQLTALFAMLRARKQIVRLLGFSYNASSKRFVDFAIRTLCRKQKLNVRDSVSLKRFTQRTGKQARLVADAAFLMDADCNFAGFGAIRKEIQQLRDRGFASIIGFNLHPMLPLGNRHLGLDEDTEAIASSLGKVLDDNPTVALMLIPHDDRPNLGDNIVLGPLAKRLVDAGYGNRIIKVNTTYPAHNIKGLCTLVDAMVSGRMHLAIAALGCGKPVAGITYQDKFEGLASHFCLNVENIISPSQLTGDEFPEILNNFVNDIPRQTQLIAEKLPEVKNLARLNFE